MEVETTKPQDSIETIPGLQPELSKRITLNRKALATSGWIFPFQAPPDRRYYRLRWYAHDPERNKKVFKSLKLGSDPQVVSAVQSWLDSIQVKRMQRRRRIADRQKQLRLWHLRVVSAHLTALYGRSPHQQRLASCRVKQAALEGPLALLNLVGSAAFIPSHKDGPPVALKRGTNDA
jgi:hypothetical protein